LEGEEKKREEEIGALWYNCFRAVANDHKEEGRLPRRKSGENAGETELRILPMDAIYTRSHDGNVEVEALASGELGLGKIGSLPYSIFPWCYPGGWGI